MRTIGVDVVESTSRFAHRGEHLLAYWANISTCLPHGQKVLETDSAFETASFGVGVERLPLAPQGIGFYPLFAFLWVCLTISFVFRPVFVEMFQRVAWVLVAPALGIHRVLFGMFQATFALLFAAILASPNRVLVRHIFYANMVAPTGHLLNKTSGVL